uniref:Elongation factor 1-gamma n=1 Tax=Riptortus pedestris TaxID=329032 RepID=R4WDA3_RIPPE|nr:elongation factor 1 gamma [Riptortus pedestris]
MASGTLYSYPDNFRTYKILIAAQYGGGSVKLAPNFVVGQSNQTPEFLAKFPLGSVPAFESKDGHCITESNAIAFYVSSNELRGATDVDRAQVIQWLSYADSEILPPASVWTFPYLGIIDFNKQDVNNAKNQIRNVLTHLNNFLLARTYLVGERLTLADVVVACSLLNLYKVVLDPSFRKGFQNVNRWFTTIINQPKVKTVLGDVKLCESEPKVPAPQGKASGDQPQGKKDKKKDKEPKENTPKEKKKKEEEPAEELDETELALAAEPKSKDPFDALPKGTFVMDDFKRCYSNEDVDKSIPFFWEHFDPENYSIWFSEYKYNDELKKVFMSCNLITGMYQRLDKMRKAAFASVILFGKDDDSTISGVWVWRGQDLAFTLSPDWQVDYESYSWTKLDPANEEHKKKINAYLAWEGTDKDGRQFNQGKIFK